MTAPNEVAIILDLDWAPDWMIDYAANVLIDKNIRATWFITHSSNAIDRLKSYSDLFELGIHPNCQKGSSQGSNEEQVLEHVFNLVPDAISMRTHGLYQSTSFLLKAAKMGVQLDASLFLPRLAAAQPHSFEFSGCNLFRVPCIWEDDYESCNSNPIWRPFNDLILGDGLKVFAFHPVHIVLNTNDFRSYRFAMAQRPLLDWNDDFITNYRCVGEGSLTAFLGLTDYMKNKSLGICLRDIIHQS